MPSSRESSCLQRIDDSEHDYLNTTYWDVSPLFFLVRDGNVEGFREAFDIRLEAYLAAGRISDNERKQHEYLTVSLVNSFMIAAILGGAYPPEANWVADRALRRIGTVDTLDELVPIAFDAGVELCELTQRSKKTDTGNFSVEQAKRYLSTHLTQELRVGDVADAVGLSPTYLSRLFKRVTGQTISAYLVSERIKTAQHLLETDERSISQIAALLHFCDQSYFTQVFRRQTGLTPRQYRDANRR